MKYPRKTNKLMMKLTKLLFVSHHDHNYVKSIQLKTPKFSCPKKTMLVLYCRKLRAYKYQFEKSKPIKLKAFFK